MNMKLDRKKPERPIRKESRRGFPDYWVTTREIKKDEAITWDCIEPVWDKSKQGKAGKDGTVLPGVTRGDDSEAS